MMSLTRGVTHHKLSGFVDGAGNFKCITRPTAPVPCRLSVGMWDGAISACRRRLRLIPLATAATPPTHLCVGRRRRS